MIFSDASHSIAGVLLKTRLLIIIPVAIFCLVLSSVVGPVGLSLAIVLITRRSAEWIGEIYLSSFEFQGNKRPVIIVISAELITLVSGITMLLVLKLNPFISLLPWALAPLLTVLCGRLAIAQNSMHMRDCLAKIVPNFGSTAIIGIATYIFRLTIVLLTVVLSPVIYLPRLP